MDGDEILVAPGTYYETIDLLGKAVWLRSTDGPEVTIIDALDTGSVVTCANGEGPETVVEGFTLTGGSGTPMDEFWFGGGMLNSGSPTVIGCTFTGNTVDGSGGGFCCSTELCVPVPDCSAVAQPCGLDHDGEVGVTDLLILLGAWGACSDCGDCPADLDDGCAVGVTDVLVLLANWGPCL